MDGIRLDGHISCRNESLIFFYSKESCSSFYKQRGKHQMVSILHFGYGKNSKNRQMYGQAA